MSRLVPVDFNDLDRMIAGSVGTLATPSVAYGVSQHGVLVASGVFGFADVGNESAATLETPYALASVSKPITAAAVMCLSDDGAFEVDDPINPYLGDCRISSRAADADLATIRQTVTHSAGLPLHYQFYYADEPFQRPRFEETTAKFAKTFWGPSDRFVYSNLGYGLLDHLIKVTSGRSYDDFMQTRVFDPLGMGSASTSGNLGNEAISYGPDGVAYPRYTFDHPGGSALYASVKDLLRFGESYSPTSVRRILSPESAKESLRKTVEIGSTRGWGFGWGNNRDRLGHEIWQHDGGMGGVRTVLRLVPACGLVIVVLSNGESPEPIPLADEILALISETAMLRLKQERVAPEPAPKKSTDLSILEGRWRGLVECGEERFPIEADIEPDGPNRIRFGNAEIELEGLAIDREIVTASIKGQIPDAEATRSPHNIHLDLVLKDGRLEGAAVALSSHTNGHGGAPGKRLGNALSYWTSLSKR